MPKSTDTWRTFIAIEIPSSIRARISQHINNLRRELPDVRASWLREENLHLTLKFLGDVLMADTPRLSEAAEKATSAVKRFELVVSGCGAFPPHGQPKVLWIGLEDISGNVQKLHDVLEDECAKRGFAREQRAFHPHLTIARLRAAKGSRHVAQLHRNLGFASGTFTVTELVVFKSELRSEGSKHTPISRHSVANK